MQLTRRDFGSWLGLLAVGGVAAAEAQSKYGYKVARVSGSNLQPEEAGEKPSASEHKLPSTPEEIWADLLQGNKRFVAGKPAVRDLVHRREELVQGQHPQVIVLGCSDSRVSPSLVFDKNLGDLFVIRTAGNVADPVALGSIEYAVEHVHSSVLLVLGHENCGAVAATASGEKMPTPNLEAIVKKIRPAMERVKGRAEGEKFLRLVEEANVHQSASDIVQNSPIVAAEASAGKLTIIKAMYGLKTGAVTRLLG